MSLLSQTGKLCGSYLPINAPAAPRMTMAEYAALENAAMKGKPIIEPKPVPKMDGPMIAQVRKHPGKSARWHAERLNQTLTHAQRRLYDEFARGNLTRTRANGNAPFLYEVA